MKSFANLHDLHVCSWLWRLLIDLWMKRVPRRRNMVENYWCLMIKTCEVVTDPVTTSVWWFVACVPALPAGRQQQRTQRLYEDERDFKGLIRFFQAACWGNIYYFEERRRTKRCKVKRSEALLCIWFNLEFESSCQHLRQRGRESPRRHMIRLAFDKSSLCSPVRRLVFSIMHQLMFSFFLFNLWMQYHSWAVILQVYGPVLTGNNHYIDVSKAVASEPRQIWPRGIKKCCKPLVILHNMANSFHYQSLYLLFQQYQQH